MTIKNVYHTRAIAVNEVIEFKKEIINWARIQATKQRTDARIAERKSVIAQHNAKAESYEFMAQYLESMDIQC